MPALRRPKPLYDSGRRRLAVVDDFVELIRYRYLLTRLVARDLSVRYKRSSLGFLWGLLNPLLLMIILSVIFSNTFRFDIPHYPVYVLSALLIWNHFARGTTSAMSCLLDNRAILGKVYVPTSVFVAASIGGSLVNLLLASGPLLLLACVLGADPNPSWLFLPIPILLSTLFAFGVGLLVSAMAIFFMDVLNVYDVVLSLAFYATPIFYPVSILPEAFRGLERYNPVFSIVDSFRQPLVAGRLPPAGEIAVASLSALIVLLAGWSLFAALSDRFPYKL